MAEQDPIEQRPGWLSAWQVYPHVPLNEKRARELNRYCVTLETALREAVVAEREACAKKAEAWLGTCWSLATAIRARSGKGIQR